jgi:hypothetical protein
MSCSTFQDEIQTEKQDVWSNRLEIAHLSLFAYLSIDKFILFFEKLSSNEARVSEMNSFTDMLTAVL